MTQKTGILISRKFRFTILNNYEKIESVVGTRPEIIRLACVLQKLDASPAIEHILVHTGQNYDYELNEVFFEDLGLRKPDYFLNAAGTNATSTAGQILINIDPVLEEVIPACVLLQRKKDIYLFFTWKRVIVVLINGYRRKVTVK